MNRHMLAQAIVMLVILWALFRWLPASKYDFDFVLGRGDQVRMLRADNEMAAAIDQPLTVRANIRSMVRGYSTLVPQRWTEMLRHVRTLERNAKPDDLVQFKGMPGNDLYVLSYYIYPLRHTGRIWEEGGSVREATHPEADWVFTGGETPRMWRPAVESGARYRNDRDVDALGVQSTDVLGQPPAPAEDEQKGSRRRKQQ